MRLFLRSLSTRTILSFLNRQTLEDCRGLCSHFGAVTAHLCNLLLSEGSANLRCKSWLTRIITFCLWACVCMYLQKEGCRSWGGSVVIPHLAARTVDGAMHCSSRRWWGFWPPLVFLYAVAVCNFVVLQRRVWLYPGWCRVSVASSLTLILDHCTHLSYFSDLEGRQSDSGEGHWSGNRPA